MLGGRLVTEEDGWADIELSIQQNNGLRDSNHRGSWINTLESANQ